MYKIQFAGFCLIILSTVLSCRKDDLPAANGSRLKMTVSKWYDSLSYAIYKYDNQNRLIGRVDSNNNGHKDSVTIEYDGQSRAITATAAYAFNGMSVGVPDQTYSLIYNNDGRIVRKVAKPPVAYVNLTRNSYAYDAKGKLIADTNYSYWANEIYGYTTYTYDGNDNVIERKTFDKLGTLQTGETMQASYDSKTNPYKDFGVLLYIIYQDDRYLSKNNRISETYQGGERVSFNYSYFNNGLPRMFSKKDNSDPSITYRDFFYE